MSRSDTGIYREIEKALRAAPTPLTCNDLYDRPNIRQYARHVNKVSDTLGNMWRRGYLTRSPAPYDKTSQVKWAYTWAAAQKTEAPLPVLSNKVEVVARNKRTKLWGKPHVEVDEASGLVSIELDSVVIVIRPK